jgi:hypothetical protein
MHAITLLIDTRGTGCKFHSTPPPWRRQAENPTPTQGAVKTLRTTDSGESLVLDLLCLPPVSV